MDLHGDLSVGAIRKENVFIRHQNHETATSTSAVLNWPSCFDSKSDGKKIVQIVVWYVYSHFVPKKTKQIM